MTTAEFSHKSRRASIEARSDYRDWKRRTFSAANNPHRKRGKRT